MNERREIAVQVHQPVKVDHHSHQNHHRPRPDFDQMYMRLEPLQDPACLVKTETEEQKWEPHTKRVEQQQHDTLSKCRGSRRQAKD